MDNLARSFLSLQLVALFVCRANDRDDVALIKVLKCLAAVAGCACLFCEWNLLPLTYGLAVSLFNIIWILDGRSCFCKNQKQEWCSRFYLTLLIVSSLYFATAVLVWKVKERNDVSSGFDHSEGRRTSSELRNQ